MLTDFTDPSRMLAQMRAQGPLVKVKFPIIGSRWVTAAHAATSQVANMVVDSALKVPQFKQKRPYRSDYFGLVEDFRCLSANSWCWRQATLIMVMCALYLINVA